MSLVSTYVRADDGKYYKNPIIRGEIGGKKWFICFDDDDPPELVVEVGMNPQAVLSEIGVVSSVHRVSGESDRQFAPRGFVDWRKAVSYFLHIRGRIPAKLMNVPPQDAWTGCLEAPGW